jgi:hypothetical protein
MLSKLMKYELKATSRLLLPLYLILICITILDRLILSFNIYNGIMGIISGILIFSFVLTVVSILVVTMILMINRFYKNLLSDEGYLMFTLPVKADQLIISKLLITLFWTILSIAAILGSVFIAFATPERMDMVMVSIKESILEFETTFGGSWVFITIELTIMFIVSLIANTLMFYVSIAIGQLFNGHKLVGSFIAYIGIYTAIQIVMLIIVGISVLFNLDDPSSLGSNFQILFPLSIIVLAACSIIFYRTTNHILNKKLNLE